MDDMIELVAPGGTDEANHGTERYRVDNSGRVRVPREAAFYLIKHAGFRTAPPASAGAGLPPPPDPVPAPTPEPEPKAPQRLVPRSTK
jgi:hypothetical protein